MKKESPRLIVMLTHNDRTVEDAYEIFEKSKGSKAKFWGFKEVGLPLQEMKELFAYMKEHGKTTILEVVAYSEEECIKGAKIAIECRCDILMGTLYYDSVNELCKQNRLKYMPFIGKVKNRPSILEGSIEDMISEAKFYSRKGVYGIDLLAYRYTGDTLLLLEKIVSEVDIPICIAGSINNYKRLDEVKSSNSWAFTIGGAFFENKFVGEFEEQIDCVCEYLDEINETD